MPLADIFTCTAILGGGPSVAKEELVRQLVTRLAEAGHVPHDEVASIIDSVLRRERLGSTGIGRGLAMPHAKHPAVARPLGVLAVCRTPVWFDSLDGEPVDVVALILAPPDRPSQHLGQASRWAEGLVRRLADAGFCGRLRRAGSAEEVMEIVQAEDGGMTRREWMACEDPAAMLRLLRERGQMSERKARLFGAACCRRHWDLLPDEARRAVEIVEGQAEGLAGREERDAVREGFTAGLGDATGPASFAGIAVSYLLAEAGHNPAGYAMDLSPWAAQGGVSQAEELAAQAEILRCLFRTPPFRPACHAPGSLSSDVLALAQAAYEERQLPNGLLDPTRLAVLADALEEAGLTDEEVLWHCRGLATVHVRGCWLIDLLTGRK